MSQKNILLIEDDLADQMSFKRLVEQERLPYTYQIAASIKQARELLASSKPFDIIISDYFLGDGTALDLLDAIQHLPFIITTGTGTEEIAIQFMRAGALDYLIKDPERNYIKILPLTIEKAIARKRATEALRESESQLRELIEKREQLSRDLHDGIMQSIYAIGLGLEDTKTRIEKTQPDANDRISEAVEGLNRVIRDLRKHIIGEEPSGLNSRQLRAELKSITRMTEASSRIGFKLDIEQSAVSRLSPDMVENLFNITREAISNSLRHSNGSSGFVSLRLTDGTVRLVVEDNGVGFDSKIIPGKGNGLSNIAVRAERISGKLKIVSRHGRGTRLTIDIPAKILQPTR